MKARRRFVCLALALLLFGCSRCSHGLRSEPVDLEDVAGYFVREGAPHPLACVIDDDCASGPGVNPENGCCDTGVHNGVYSRAYLDWRAGWRRDNCARVECPMLPPPAPPRPCATQGRCADGRCVHTCEGSIY